MIDLDRAAEFMATHARLLDRRRFELITGRGGTDEVLAALQGYRNADGGYGAGLEPDLRSVGSQPVGALHAFEVFEEIAPVTSPHAVQLCDWLASVTLADGGLPFALPITDPAGCAPFWAQADHTQSSVHATCMLAAIAHRVAEHDPAVAAHPWLLGARSYCLRQVPELPRPRNAYEFRFVLEFLNSVCGTHPAAGAELKRLGEFVPASGTMPVEGGTPDDAMGPLEFSPRPGEPLRELFPAEVIEAELDRLAAGQQDDGGWTVTWQPTSPAGELDWRGWATVRALSILRTNHRT